MKYEIPREAFKQRLEDRLNFVFIDLMSEEKSPVKFKDVVHMNFGTQFKTEFAAQYPNKNQNIVVYSLQKGDEAPAKAAQELSDAGYEFVYFYNGTPNDIVLDKGLN